MKKLLLKIIVISVIIFCLAHLLVAVVGKGIAIKKLEELTAKKVNIAYLGLVPPLNLEIKGLNIEGLIKAESISLSPNILGFFIGRIAFNNISVISPEFDYEVLPPKKYIAAFTSGAPAAVKAKKPPRLALKRISIKGGKLNFIDRTTSAPASPAGRQGVKVNVTDINFYLDNLYIFPRSVMTKFELQGKIPWQEGKEPGKIFAKGWLNLLKKDMEATLKVSDIDGISLYPYYSNWVNLEEARIEKAVLNFTSDIKGVDNNVTAACHLELTDIVRRPLESNESEEKAGKIADMVLDVFRALNQGKIVLDFTIRTKMDRPEFGFGNIRMAFEDKLSKARGNSGFKPQDVLLLPGRFLEGTIKGINDVSKTVIDSAVNAGIEIKKSVEDSFKKAPVQEEEKKQ